MSWDQYITELLSKPAVFDAAIFCSQTGVVWAAKCGGNLGKMKPAEVLQVISGDRCQMFQQGFQVAELSCTLVRDEPAETIPCVIAKTKGCEKMGINFARSCRTVVAVTGHPNSTDSGNLNTACYKMAEYLKGVGF